jgi:hypothetical protein
MMMGTARFSETLVPAYLTTQHYCSESLRCYYINSTLLKYVTGLSLKSSSSYLYHSVYHLKLFILLTHCTYVFHVILTINSNFVFTVQNLPVGLYNEEGVVLLAVSRSEF